MGWMGVGEGGGGVRGGGRDMRLNMVKLCQGCPMTWQQLVSKPPPLPSLCCTVSVCRLSCRRASNNNLSGTLPPSWGTNSSLPRLRVAALHGNRFTGTLPADWASPDAMQALEELWLQVAAVAAAVPAAGCCHCRLLPLLPLPLLLPPPLLPLLLLFGCMRQIHDILAPLFVVVCLLAAQPACLPAAALYVSKTACLGAALWCRTTT